MKRVILSSVITLLIIVLVGSVFFYYNKSPLFQNDPITAIPTDAALIFRSTSAGRNLKQLFSNEAWQSGHRDQSNGALGFLDSLLSSNIHLNEYWEQKTLYVSLHVTKAGSFDYLLLFNTTKELGEKEINSLFDNMGTRIQRRYENVTIFEYALPRSNFSYAVSGGIFIGSFTSFLVEDAVRQLKSGTPVTRNNAFKEVNTGADKELVCYVNFDGMGGLVSNYSGIEANDIIHFISGLADWSGLSFNIQSHSFFLNGLSAAADTSQLLALFNRQFPVESKISEIAPQHTAFLLSFGFSNAPAFLESSRKNASFANSGYEEQIGKLNRQYRVDIEKKLTSWMGKSMSLIITEPGNVNFSNNSYLCIEAASPADAKKMLESLRSRVNRNLPDKSENYRDFQISRIHLENIVPLVYGKLFSRFGYFFYTQIKNFVIIGNSASSLRSFIDSYQDNQTLSNFTPASDAIKSLPNTGNLFLYMHLPFMENILKAYALKENNTALDGERSLLKQLTTFSVSFAAGRNGIQTSMLLNLLSEGSRGIRLVASTQLDTAITFKPFILADPAGHGDYIAIQDEANQLYLLDESADVLWKQPLEEKILGEIHIVDYFRNGSVQMLFNTASSLYLVDLKGQYVGNYPIRFPSRADAGCTVVAEKISGYLKTYLHCINGIVYAYELSGKPVGNWTFTTPFGGPVKPLLQFQHKGKTFLVIYNLTGEVKTFDEYGNELNFLAPLVEGGIRSELKIFSDSNSTVFLTEDNYGHLARLTTDGKIKLTDNSAHTDPYDFSRMPWKKAGESLYAVNTVDSFITFDDSGNRVFGIAMQSSRESEIRFHRNAGTHQFIVVSGTGRIYSFDVEGKAGEGFPIKGTVINYTEGREAGKETWVTADREGMVYVYERR